MSGYTIMLEQAPYELREYIAQDIAMAKNITASSIRNTNGFNHLKQHLMVYLNHIDSITKEEFNAPFNTKPDCFKGCSWCCYFRVTTSPIEIFLIADYITSNMTQQSIDELSAKLAEVKNITLGLTPQEHILKKICCPLLLDGKCSVYSVRPLHCRGYYSHDAEQCKNELNNTSINVSYNGTVQWRFKATYIGISMSLEEFCIFNDPVELVAGLHRALSQPDMFSEWLRGAKFF